MVVEEDCLATCDGQAAHTHARRYGAEEGHHTYRKMLNLRPMRGPGDRL
jgi:hypothetical protein